jgi:hypothetical protein
MISIERKKEYKEYCQQLYNIINQIEELKQLSKRIRRNSCIYTLPASAPAAQEPTAPMLNIPDAID